MRVFFKKKKKKKKSLLTTGALILNWSSKSFKSTFFLIVSSSIGWSQKVLGIVISGSFGQWRALSLFLGVILGFGANRYNEF